jgi:hypothetical protein
MPRKNHRASDDRNRRDNPDGRSGRSDPHDHRGEPRRQDPSGQRAPARELTRRGQGFTLDLSEPDIEEQRAASVPYNVIVTAHAARQMDELGPPAERALRYLREAGREELRWSAQSMPSQRGRDVWLLGAGMVRVLLDVEGDDLTIQGFGLQPHRHSIMW